MRFPSLTLLLLLPAGLLWAVDQEAVRRAVEQGDLRPLTEILQQVQASHAGRVLDVDLEVDPSGRRIYEIELLRSDSSKTVVRVDARTGQVLERDLSADDKAMIALPDLLRAALARYPGHVIDVEFDRDHYSVELALADGGHVRLGIDARDGTIVEHGRFSQALDGILSMPEVVERVLARLPGKVVEAELERDRNGTPYYELDILTPDADVIEVHVDAVTGEILQVGEA